MSALPAETPGDVLTVRDLSKNYGATQALAGVSLTVRAGEVLGLIGTNGAGKSTLIKVLSGATAPSSGEVLLDGAPVDLSDPLAAQAAGIATVHQEINDGIVPGTSVAENLTLDRIAAGGGWFTTRRSLRAAAAAVARDADLHLDLDARIDDLPPAARQQVVLARVLARRPRLLVLDEPTSSLSTEDAQVLIDSVRRLAATGVAVLYVSHRLGEVRSLCDRVVVLRDGRVRGVHGAGVRGPELVAAMLGDRVAAMHPERHVATGPPVLTATGVRALPSRRPFDLRVGPGEILGLVGLVGAGKTELLEQLFGARPLESGSLTLGGRDYRPRGPHDAVTAGVALVGEERASQGVVPGWSLRHHVTLPRLSSSSTAGLMRTGAEDRAATRTVRDFGVVTPGAGVAMAALSGGNQQKVLVGRWLDGASRLVLLDEPFRGVDVGARADISQRLRERSADVAVVVASSDPEEVLAVSDRILVLHEGDAVGEVDVRDVTDDRLAALMSGERPDRP